jgi:hypothetical protein
MDETAVTQRFERFRKLRLLSRVVFTMPSKKYLNYMRSPAWFARRRDHMSAYPDCQMPGCWRPAVQVHHWYYGRLGQELECDLCSICLDCHHKLHCMTLPDAANDNKPDQLDLFLAARGSEDAA